MILKYNGVDITDSVDIYRCWHDMHAHGKADMLTIMFDDADSLWDQWNPEKGDKITVEENDLNTGTMYVHKKIMRGKYFTLIAAAVPVSYNLKRSKAWQDVRLLQVGQEIAKLHGLEFYSYGVENNLYPYILQKNEQDFIFLDKLCSLEGCAFLVHDKKLVIYSIEFMERAEPAGELLLDTQSKYHIWDNSNNLYGNCKVVKGTCKGAHKIENGSDRMLIPHILLPVGNSADAIRFAKNLLIRENSCVYSGFFRAGNIYEEYVPASTLDLQIERTPSWNGRVFVTDVRNDYIAGTGKIFFRRIV